MNRIELREISSNVLELICRYLNERATKGVSLYNFAPLQQIDPSKEGDRQLVVELLLAANYLDC